jgi:hypothetical protein
MPGQKRYMLFFSQLYLRGDSTLYAHHAPPHTPPPSHPVPTPLSPLFRCRPSDPQIASPPPSSALLPGEVKIRECQIERKSRTQSPEKQLGKSHFARYVRQRRTRRFCRRREKAWERDGDSNVLYVCSYLCHRTRIASGSPTIRYTVDCTRGRRYSLAEIGNTQLYQSVGGDTARISNRNGRSGLSHRAITPCNWTFCLYSSLVPLLAYGQFLPEWLC